MKPLLRPWGWGLIAASVTIQTCAPAGYGDGRETGRGGRSATEAILQRAADRIDSAATSMDSIFQPLPLLRPAEEDSLRQFSNEQHLARARALGVGRLLRTERLQALEREGTLVRLSNSRYWVIRDLDYSQPLAIPAVRALLEEIGERFHAALATRGAPPFRLEITSMLRTAADQEALRRVNPNAAGGESTHEYGTTFDVLYSAYSAPAEPIARISIPEAEWIEPYLRRYADIVAERVAARRALEVKAILGKVLIEMQQEGKAMVTIERLQPVYHITVAK